ncbi:MAG: crotonase/enoyl-CoA hydratase family protein [Pseudomonadota bacterium]
MTDTVLSEIRGATHIITINRPQARNAVNLSTAASLKAAFLRGEADPEVKVQILTGAGGHFCAGADLKAVGTEADKKMRAYMGPSWLELTKPTIAAVEGPAVAGGLELSLVCDLRIAGQSAFFGVYCRRWGVPLIDGGTVRLPRLIGQSRAMDMILTGRKVDADEAYSFGLANRVVPDGQTLEVALEMAELLATFPQTCLRSDRQSVLEQWSLPMADALENEAVCGERAIEEAKVGAARFVSGKGRSGDFSDI